MEFLSLSVFSADEIDCAKKFGLGFGSNQCQQLVVDIVLHQFDSCTLDKLCRTIVTLF